jgi:hypothetical protein
MILSDKIFDWIVSLPLLQVCLLAPNLFLDRANLNRTSSNHGNPRSSPKADGDIPNLYDILNLVVGSV